MARNADVANMTESPSEVTGNFQNSLVPKSGTRYISSMNVISKRALKTFWERHPPAATPLKVWHAQVSAASWRTPQDIKATFGATVDFVGDNRVIFDIGGNKYRLVTRVAYAPYYRVLIKFVGTHAEYDRIDPETV